VSGRYAAKHAVLNEMGDVQLENAGIAGTALSLFAAFHRIAYTFDLKLPALRFAGEN
jgi:hypothetical protein